MSFLINDFAQQDGTSIAEARHPSGELMTGIDLRQWLGPIGDAVASQHVDAFRAAQFGVVDAEVAGERVIDRDQAWFGHG